MCSAALRGAHPARASNARRCQTSVRAGRRGTSPAAQAVPGLTTVAFAATRALGLPWGPRLQSAIATELWDLYGGKYGGTIKGFYLNMEVGNTLGWMDGRSTITEQFFTPVTQHVRGLSTSSDLETFTSPGVYVVRAHAKPRPDPPPFILHEAYVCNSAASTRSCVCQTQGRRFAAGAGRQGRSSTAPGRATCCWHDCAPCSCVRPGIAARTANPHDATAARRILGPNLYGRPRAQLHCAKRRCVRSPPAPRGRPATVSTTPLSAPALHLAWTRAGCHAFPALVR